VSGGLSGAPGEPGPHPRRSPPLARAPGPSRRRLPSSLRSSVQTPSAPGPIRRVLARLVLRGLDGLRHLAARALGADHTAGREDLTEAELRDLVAANTQLDGEKRRLIDDVLTVGARHVRELMVPRTEVVFLEAKLTIGAALRLVRDTRHSRFPVIDGSQDDVVGFVHLRDLTIRPQVDGLASVGELARDVKRVPASKRVLPALSEMRRERHHLAVVIDEYGGTAGIVTLEDLIEELVGEIHDEYDAAPEPAPEAGSGPSEVDGLLNLSDFTERAGLELPPGPYETVGGFLMARLGKLPAVGDEVRLEGWRLTVTALDGRRVARVTLTPPVTPIATAVPA
jgi:magnesium and cobalt exporter, CNNM family